MRLEGVDGRVNTFFQLLGLANRRRSLSSDAAFFVFGPPVAQATRIEGYPGDTLSC